MKKKQLLQNKNNGAGRPPQSDEHHATTSRSVHHFIDLISLDVDLERATQVSLKDKKLDCLPPQIGTILPAVRKLDLAENDMTDVAPLAGLKMLSHLTLSQNARLGSLQSLHLCKSLVVLSVASCGLVSLQGLEASAATLRTLIANDNNIVLQSPQMENPSAITSTAQENVAVQNYEVLAQLTACQTVVLSRNRHLCDLYTPPQAEEEGKPKHKDRDEVEDDDEEEDKHKEKSEEEMKAQAARAKQHPLSVFEQMPNLRKLSLSECGLRSMPERWFLPLLTELRLAQNHLTSFQPKGVILRSLKILDVSHNELQDAHTLRRCHFVRQVNVRGNPFATTCEAQDREAGIIPAEATGAISVSLQAQVARVLKHVEMVDGRALLPEEERKKIILEASKRARVLEEQEKTRKKSAESTPSHKKNKVDPTLIAAEAEEKDVVIEVPEAVTKKSSTPIVRRDRIIKAVAPHQVKREGGAAVASILKRKENASW